MGQVYSESDLESFQRLIFLSSQLFGEDEDATGELDDAEKQGENGKVD